MFGKAMRIGRYAVSKLNKLRVAVSHSNVAQFLVEFFIFPYNVYHVFYCRWLAHVGRHRRRPGVQMGFGLRPQHFYKMKTFFCFRGIRIQLGFVVRKYNFLQRPLFKRSNIPNKHIMPVGTHSPREPAAGNKRIWAFLRASWINKGN